MENQELIVHLSKDIVFTATEVEDAINGLTNQSSGFMALKSICQKENLNTNSVFTWIRDKGWLKAYPEVTGKAIIDWNSHNIDPINGTIFIEAKAILIQIINNSHYINTKCLHYESFIAALRDAGCIGGYNRDVKDAVPKPTPEQLRVVKELYNLRYKK